MMQSLLVIDDDEGLLYSFEQVFANNRTRVLTAATGVAGLAQFRVHSPDVIVLDLHLPDSSGLDVFRRIKAVDPKKPVIFITANGTTATAIEAIKNGAFDYVVKPADLERLGQVVDRAFEAARLTREPAALPLVEFDDEIIGRSPTIQEMCKTIGRVARQDVGVLILGETGAGKELVARAIYCNSARADKPFLAINCAAIPEALLESELFGHEAGAFTGANRRRVGKFELCNGGTLFLDEIGDMTPNLQAKMLRVLQDQQFERVGGNETLRTDVRILTATNQNLETLADEGLFRRDLYYRIKVVEIQVPPLRERPGDVMDLAHHFLSRFNSELSLKVRSFAPEVLRLFEAYSWPGNVRELQGVIKGAMLRAGGPVILTEFLPAALRRQTNSLASAQPSSGESQASVAPIGPEFNVSGFVGDLLARGETDVYAKVVEQVDRLVLTHVLRLTQGHQVRASQILGINRATLRAKMRSLDLAVDTIVTANVPNSTDVDNDDESP